MNLPPISQRQTPVDSLTRHAAWADAADTKQASANQGNARLFDASPARDAGPASTAATDRAATDRAVSGGLVSDGESVELKKAFTDFVGQTLFGSMLASMRKTVGKPAYVHGGRTEEVFQQQLDQKIVEELTESSAESIAEPMFELFSLQRR